MGLGVVLLAVVAAVALLGALGFYLAYEAERQDAPDLQQDPGAGAPAAQPPWTHSPAAFEGTQEIKKFSSEDDLLDFLADVRMRGGFDMLAYAASPGISIREGISAPEPQLATTEGISMREGGADSPFQPAPDFSSTNVQVAGVDEPDFLKTDGDYLYLVSDRILTIVDAHPAEEAEITARVALDVEPQHMHNAFLNGDRLMVFYNGSDEKQRIPEFGYAPHTIRVPVTHAMILDVSDRGDPRLVRDYRVDGSFTDARMIGDHVYLVTSLWIGDDPVVPRVGDAVSGATVLEPDVFYFDNYEDHYEFNTVTAINVSDGGDVSSETFLMGPASSIYVSSGGLYMAYEKSPHGADYGAVQRDGFFEVILPLLPQDLQDRIEQAYADPSSSRKQKWDVISGLMQEAYGKMAPGDRDLLFLEMDRQMREYHSKAQDDINRTVVHRILLDGGRIAHHATGEVPGWLLNQFSMDEHGDRFRVATTNDSVSPDGRFSLSNAVYVLDRDDLSVVGSVEGLAPDESIFSARFMGDRLYLVTFELIDPFFVIDLSGDVPVVLGELKIPGFSNYLHPYDADHVIGVGRDTDASGNRVTQLGVKLALFDVSDVANPSVLDDVVIGDSSAYSGALDNHKAFFFDAGRGILSIPVRGTASSLIHDVPAGDRAWHGGDAWGGFYVYGLDTTDGFQLKGKVDHSESEGAPGGDRSLHIGGVLYTVSSKLIKMNDLDHIANEINSIDLGPTGALLGYVD